MSKQVNMRLWIPILAATIVLSPSVQAMTSRTPGDRPNIILCMTDDQGWGDVAYNGHPVLKTPELDAMAAAGLRFNRFYAAHPQCSPTRGSVLTGRHPIRYGCFRANMSIRPGAGLLTGPVVAAEWGDLKLVSLCGTGASTAGTRRISGSRATAGGLTEPECG